MKKTLKAELGRLKGLPFGRTVNRGKLVREFHALADSAKGHQISDFDQPLFKKVYEWVFVPLSLWPVDIEGLLLQMIESVKSGAELDAPMRLQCALLQRPPETTVCRAVCEHERNVRSGSYETLIAAQHKFDNIERSLRENPELRADWELIKARFDVDKYRSKMGVIRRRPVQERNFHPADWKFGWATEAEQFQNVFDAFCHKWDLYGVQKTAKRGEQRNALTEGNEANKEEIQPRNKRNTLNGDGTAELPSQGRHESDAQRETISSRFVVAEYAEGEEKFLLLKLTVTITPYGTLIMIPRYWSADTKRDLKWHEITKLHRLRSATKQGLKQGINEVERRREAERAQEFWAEATAAGLKGDRRDQWVMGRLGWVPETDVSKLRRLLKCKVKSDAARHGTSSRTS